MRTTLIYYSPTGTTKKIIREIGSSSGFEVGFEYNIAESKELSNIHIESDTLAIIGIPVYGGRLPINVIDTLKNLKATQQPAVIVVVYGNRAYEDSLLELKEIASNCGFTIVAAAAFIGEHSFSNKENPIAKGRPDKQDLEKCHLFSKEIVDKLHLSNDTDGFNELKIPGNYPYKVRKVMPSTVHPEIDNDLCIFCGNCKAACPVNAITIEDRVVVNGELCTLCCACVRSCPEEAITLNNPAVAAIREKLTLGSSKRREPVYFI